MSAFLSHGKSLRQHASTAKVAIKVMIASTFAPNPRKAPGVPKITPNPKCQPKRICNIYRGGWTGGTVEYVIGDLPKPK
jgi:hypothetical protein